MTGIRVNRSLAETRAILGTSETAGPGFQTVEIRGQPISATIRYYPARKALILALTRPEFNRRFALLAFTPVEFRSAIRRRQRAGDIEKPVAVGIINRFTQHVETKFIQQALSEAVLDTASGLIDRYPLRRTMPSNWLAAWPSRRCMARGIPSSCVPIVRSWKLGSQKGFRYWTPPLRRRHRAISERGDFSD